MFNDFNNMPKKLTDDDNVDMELLDADSDSMDDNSDDDESVNVDDIDADIGIMDTSHGNNSKDKINHETISIPQKGSRNEKKNKQGNKKKPGKEDKEREPSEIEKNIKSLPTSMKMMRVWIPSFLLSGFLEVKKV